MNNECGNHEQRTHDSTSNGTPQCPLHEGCGRRIDATTYQLIGHASSDGPTKGKGAKALNGGVTQNRRMRDRGKQHMAHFGFFHRDRPAIGATAKTKKYHDGRHEAYGMGGMSNKGLQLRAGELLVSRKPRKEQNGSAPHKC